MSLTSGFTAPPWTQQTHCSVDDITFLDFLPYYILKTMFIYCIHYETTDILIWVANNTNTAKTLMFPRMCIKQSCVCTTASRIVHEHARKNTQLLSWFGAMMSTSFILLVLELNKAAFWRAWIFKTEKIKDLIYSLRYLFFSWEKITVCILEDTALPLWLLGLLRASTGSEYHLKI